jgi:hypothetical protein
MSSSKDLSIPAWPDDSRSGGAEKIVFVLLILLIAAAAALIFLGAIGAVSLAHTLPYGAQIEKVVFFSALPGPMGRVLAAGASGAVGLLAFVVLFRRLTGSARRPEARHVLISDERGYVFVEKRGISTVGISAIKRVHGVVDADVRVIGGGAAPVRLAIRVGLHAGAELIATGEKVRAAAIDAVEKLVGLEVHDVLVKVDVIPLEDLDRLVQ